MGVFFRTILAYRNIRLSETEKYVPLWKLKLTEEEEEQLVSLIRSNIDSSSLEQYAIEIILLYSVWWATRYRGGAHSWETALFDMGICSEKEARDTYKYKIARIVRNEFEDSLFGLTLYRSKGGSRRFLESSLVQGGFPVNALRELKDASSGFQLYLQCLYDRYCSFPINDPIWNDSTIAETLADKYLNNRSFKNESFYEACLEIIKAASFPEEYSFDTNRDEYVRRILEGLKRRPKSIQNTFSIEWLFRRIDNHIEILYRLLCPTDINSVFNAEERISPVESFYIDNQCLATYQNRHRVSYVSKPVIRDIGQGAIRMWREYLYRKEELSEGEPRIEPFNGLRCSTLPDLDYPVILCEDDQFWKVRKATSNGALVCLFPHGWTCDLLPVSDEVLIADRLYHWCSFDWDSLDAAELCFRNSDGEFYSCSRIESNYELSLNVLYPGWIDSVSGNCPLVINTDTRSLLSIYNSDSSVSPFDRTVKLEYKTSDQSEYSPLRAATNLPSCKIRIRVTLPDHTVKTLSFYNINGIGYNRESDSKFSFHWPDGVVRLDSSIDQLCDECGRNTFVLREQNTISDKNPISLVCSSYRDGSRSCFRVISPNSRPAIYDSKGQLLRTRSISINDLYKYRFSIKKRNTLKLSCICGGEIKIRSSFRHLEGEFPLDYIKKYIDKYNILFGFDGADAFVEMSIEESGTVYASLRIKMHAHHVEECQGINGKGVIVLSENKEKVSGLNLGLVVPDEPDDSEYCRRVISLVEDRASGIYYPEEPVFGKDFIVFAKDTDVQVFPTMIYANSSPKEWQREINKKENLKRQSSMLEDLGDLQLWKNVLFYLETVIEHHLPYQTFNCFTAIKDSPEALFELCLRSSRRRGGRDLEFLVDEFIRYANEMGFSFHYIPCDIVRRSSEEHMNRFLSCGYEKEEVEQLMEREYGLYYGILARRVSDYYAAQLYLLSFKGVSTLGTMSFQSISDYLAKCNQTFFESETDKEPLLFHPQELKSANFDKYVILDPKVIFDGDTRNRILKMRYFCIVAPQLAAYAYINKYDFNLWENDKCGIMPYMRRMINFVSTYAPEAYRDIFITTVGILLSK